MGVNVPVRPPSQSDTATNTSISCTSFMPRGSRPNKLSVLTMLLLIQIVLSVRDSRLYHAPHTGDAVAMSWLKIRSKPTFFPASSASFHVRISGRPLPKLISSMMRTCSGFLASYRLVDTHSYVTKRQPGLSTRYTSPNTSSSFGAWHVASIAYAPSNDAFSNGILRKSPRTTVVRGATPSFSLWWRARSTWYWLIVRPTTCAPDTEAMVRSGPPTPQPTSTALSPGLRPSSAAMRVSWAASLAFQSLPGSLGEKWNDWPQPHS
mmetsp:Transcript_28449/g.61881  ORF Transcript_28449/g.61881 Transcript_28449/m.61881 type:complete len:264 (-) Transcript_28449:157-948(-)